MEKNHIHQCKHNSKLQNSKFTAFQKDYYYAFASSLVAVFCLASGTFDASIFVVPLVFIKQGRFQHMQHFIILVSRKVPLRTTQSAPHLQHYIAV